MKIITKEISVKDKDTINKGIYETVKMIAQRLNFKFSGWERNNGDSAISYCCIKKPVVKKLWGLLPYKTWRHVLSVEMAIYNDQSEIVYHVSRDSAIAETVDEEMANLADKYGIRCYNYTFHRYIDGIEK